MKRRVRDEEEVRDKVADERGWGGGGGERAEGMPLEHAELCPIIGQFPPNPLQ